MTLPGDHVLRRKYMNRSIKGLIIFIKRTFSYLILCGGFSSIHSKGRLVSKYNESGVRHHDHMIPVRVIENIVLYLNLPSKLSVVKTISTEISVWSLLTGVLSKKTMYSV